MVHIQKKMSMVSKINTKGLQEKPLGVYLVEAGLITPTQIDMALNTSWLRAKQY
jgi:hypothetical protein